MRAITPWLLLFVALFGRQWNHAHDVAVLRSYVRNWLWNPFTSVVTRSYVRNRIRKRRFCVRPSIIFLGRPFAPSSLYRIVRSLLLYRERTLLLIPSRNTFFFLGIRNSILSNTLLRPSGSDHWKHHRRECNETTMAMVNLAQEETKTEWNERKGQWKTKIQSPLTSWR